MPVSGHECNTEQNGCPASACDGTARTWCVVKSAPCAQEERSYNGGWAYCTPTNAGASSVISESGASIRDVENANGDTKGSGGAVNNPVDPQILPVIPSPKSVLLKNCDLQMNMMACVGPSIVPGEFCIWDREDHECESGNPKDIQEVCDEIENMFKCHGDVGYGFRCVWDWRRRKCNAIGPAPKPAYIPPRLNPVPIKPVFTWNTPKPVNMIPVVPAKPTTPLPSRPTQTNCKRILQIQQCVTTRGCYWDEDECERMKIKFHPYHKVLDQKKPGVGEQLQKSNSMFGVSTDPEKSYNHFYVLGFVFIFVLSLGIGLNSALWFSKSINTFQTPILED